MPVIGTTLRELSQRGDSVRRLLRPISKVGGGPAWGNRTGSGNYIIGTHDGSPPSSDFREWRFATSNSSMRAMYFECWKEYGRDRFYLFQAYLSLFQVDRLKTEREFIALHCDPDEPDNSPHSTYKKGPHLHILVADHPLPHAHLVLNRGHLEAVLSSPQSLSEAIGSALIMIRDEILDAM